MDAAGHCLGAIAVMEQKPRTFTSGEIKFLEIIARWSMSEFERNRLLKAQDTSTAYQGQGSRGAGELLSRGALEQGSRGAKENVDFNSPVPLCPSAPLPETAPLPLCPSAPSLPPDPLSTIQVKLELLAQLVQELRTPLTSVLGMASVVSREIYGPLTSKQKEYVEIIQNSGRYLLSIVNEISELGSLNDSTQTLNLTSVDIEMLCQQVLNTLSDAAKRREQLIRLSVEPGRSRIWVLDKDKIRQLLYHLVFSVIQAAITGSIICIHISHKDYGLNLAISVSHPWLGDGLTQVDPYFGHFLPVPVVAKEQSSVGVLNKLESQSEMVLALPAGQPLELSISSSDPLATELESELAQPNSSNCSGASLRLVISCHLAQLHGGQISIQGTPESGYRYVVSLPELTAVEENL